MKRFAYLLSTVLIFSLALTVQAQDTKNEVFGTSFEAKKVMDYDKFVKKMDKKGGLEEVVLKGKVEPVCQMKGCWMNIVSDSKTDKVTKVKFENYGFFVPKDIAGRTVIMKGNGYQEVTPVDELRHMAEDAGKSKEEIMKITKPEKELKFMATGVILLPGA